MPKDNSERIIDWPYSPTKSRSGTVSSGGGGGGGGSSTLAGLSDVSLSAPANGQVLTYNSATGQWVNSAAGTYTAGSAIAISGGNVISVIRYSDGAIGITGGGLSVNVGDGIQILSNALTLNLSSVPGLEYGSGTDAGKVQVKITDGLGRTVSGIGIKLKTTSGLELDSSGLAIADAIAGNGLVIAGKVLAVGAGDGIDVFADSIAVDVTDFIDTAAGLQEDASNNIQLKLGSNPGLQFSGAGGLVLGAPSTLSVSSANGVTSATHSHAITTSADVGTTPAQAILASTTGGALTLAQLTLVGNLIFAGGNRSITASNSLTIAPTTDLILDPTGLVLTPNAQEVRAVTINDLPTGIDGFRIWNRYANYTQLTIGAIKADELYVRVFVADETRIDRGEEYWSKSFGVVQEDFALPAVGGTADVWFEDAPAAVSFNIFAANDWLLMRTIDWGTGLVVQKVWFFVIAKIAQETTAANGVDRQKWQVMRWQGGINGTTIKRGNLMIDAGVVGQGWVHLSALSQDGGPFIQIGAMSSTSPVPQFTNYVRMGNLKGTVDYGATNVYGFAAGSGSGGLGTTPSGGFSGLTADASNGLRLFNTNLQMYSGGVLSMSLTLANGLRFLQDSAALANSPRYIAWYDSLSPLGNRVSYLATFGTTNPTYELGVNAYGAFHASALILRAMQDTPSQDVQILLNTSTSAGGDTIRFATSTAQFGGKLSAGQGFTTPASTIHFFESTTSTGASAGVTIEQGGTGDTDLHFRMGSSPIYTIGIDNSDSNKLKIAMSASLGTSDALTIHPNGPVTVQNFGASPFVFDIFHTMGAGTPGVYGVQRWGNVAGQFELGLYATLSSGLITYKYAIYNNSTLYNDMLVLDRGATGFGQTPNTDGRITVRESNTLFYAIKMVNRNNTRTWGIAIDVAAVDDGKLSINDATAGLPRVTLDTNGNAGIGTTTPGIDVLGTTDIYDSSNFPIVQIDGTYYPHLVLRGTLGPTIDLIATSGTANQRWMRIQTGFAGYTNFDLLNDTGNTVVTALAISHSTAFVGMGTLTLPGAQLDIAAEGGNNPLRLQAYTSTQPATIIGRRSRGSQSVPSTVQNGDVLFGIGGVGYTSGGWALNFSAYLDFRATEAYDTGTNGKGGAEIRFWTRPNGGTGVVQAGTFQANGALSVPYIWSNTVTTIPNVTIDSAGVLKGTTHSNSSRRYKQDIRSVSPGHFDSFIESLTPVRYKMKEEYGGDGTDRIGFIAEAVVDAGGADFVQFDNEGRPDVLLYDRLIVPAIAALQQLIPYKARIQELEARLAELERRLN